LTGIDRTLKGDRMKPQSTVVALALFTVVALAFGAPAAAAPQGTAQPIASAETNWSGIALDLMSVERKGSVLTLKWAVRNHGTADKEVQFGLVGEHVTTYVVDEDSGTKYYVLTDKEKNSLASMHEYTGGGTSGIDDKIPAGESRRYWAKFPAPPPEVKTVTLFFAKTEPFEEVPITDR
jgi:hypothetical protein